MQSGGVAIFATVLALPSAASASPVWLPVTHTTKARGHAYPEVVKTQAEQAAVPLEKADGRAVFGGAGGPTNLQTRHLHFECRGATYDVPDPFVDDLLWLGADSSVRASMSARDVVFSMIGVFRRTGLHGALRFPRGPIFPTDS